MGKSVVFLRETTVLGGLLGVSWGASWGRGELEASWRAPGGLCGPSGGPIKKYEKPMVLGLEANFYCKKPWFLLS